MMGSGGMVVVDDSTCMVDFARFFLSFTAEESCGKCAPCRVGTGHLVGILDRDLCRQGRAGRPRAPRAPRPRDQERLAVRARPDGAQPGALLAEVLPRRVRGAHRARSAAGPSSAATSSCTASSPASAPAASAACRSARPAPSPARGRRPTTSTRRSASSAARATRSAASTPSPATRS